MSTLQRIGVAIESDLLEAFDHLIAHRGSPSRSEAFRDLIRDALVQHAASSSDAIVVGTVTLVYDHHVRLLNEKLTSLQHDAHDCILSTLHVHLDHDNCLEVIVVRGVADEVRRIADGLISMKGVSHGRLTLTTPRAEPAAVDDPRAGRHRGPHHPHPHGEHQTKPARSRSGRSSRS